MNFQDVNKIPNDFKNKWYVFFNFYHNTEEDIEKFKERLFNMFPNLIIGFKRSDNYAHYRLLVYVESQADCDLMKTDDTLNLYNEYVNSGIYEGYKVF